MSMAVKPLQAFFWAARTNHAAGFVPLSQRFPAPPLHPHAARWAWWRWRKQLRSAGVHLGPGTRPERPSIRVEPATVPSTFHRIRVERPARHGQEPTHRTNGAFTGSPGGTTAALADHACSTPLPATAPP